MLMFTLKSVDRFAFCHRGMVSINYTIPAQLDTVFSMMVIMHIFSSMCGLNLGRSVTEIVMRRYFTAYLEIVEGCVEYFACISYVYPSFKCS